MPRAIARDAPGDDFTPLRDVSFQAPYIFEVEYVNFLHTEMTLFLSDKFYLLLVLYFRVTFWAFHPHCWRLMRIAA